MAFSATRAALEGFRVVGRRPFSVLVWAVFWLVVSAALIVGACYMLGSTVVGDMIAHSHDREYMRDWVINNEQEFWTSFGGVFQYLGVLLGVMILACIIQMCAVFRAVLRPQDRGLGYLKFGGDELRQIGLMIITMLFYGVLSFAASFGIVFGIHAADLGEHMSLLLGALAAIICAVIFITLGVRLSLAQAMTFAQKRIRFFASWGLTKGHFWGLLGAYLLAVIFAGVVGFLGDELGQFVGGLLGFNLSGLMEGQGLPADLDDLSPTQLATLLGTGGLAYFVISSIVSAIQMAVSYAPQAAAYRDLMEERNPPAPEPVAAPPPPEDHGPTEQAAEPPAQPAADTHGPEAAALAAGAAIAAGAAAFAADAHAHAETHGSPDSHGAPAPEAHPQPALHAEPAHVEPAPVEAFHAEPAQAEPAADHGHAEPAPEAHAQPAAVVHAESLAETPTEPVAEAYVEPHAELGAAEAHVETHPEPQAEAHAEAAPEPAPELTPELTPEPSAEAHPEPEAPPAPQAHPVAEAHAEPAAEVHAEAHPAADAHPASPHDDAHAAPPASDHSHGH